MGDRGCIVIVEGKEPPVWLYTHVTGEALPKVLQAALKRSKGNLTYAPYLTRAIFCEMLAACYDDPKEAFTDDGFFGIWTTPQGHNYPDLWVDIEKQEVRRMPRDGKPLWSRSFAEFIEKGVPTKSKRTEVGMEDD